MSKKKFGMKDFKKDMSRTQSVSAGMMIILAIVFLGSIIIVDIVSDEGGYDRGYAQALNDKMELQNWEEFKTFSYEVKKQAFWTVIMWEVTTHLSLIFWMIVVLLAVLFLRF